MLGGWIAFEEVSVTGSAPPPGPVTPDVAVRAASCELGPAAPALR
jgi:hypothetical protein